jgi:putative SOS response-associated peptidase YedK
MCGRLSSKSQREVIAKLYDATLALDHYVPSHNVAPTEKAPIVREGADHKRTAELATFGILTTIPGRPTFNLINLQSEKAAGRKDFKERRCVIPADGFYEWEKISEKEKQPHYVYPTDGLFSFGGIWKETATGLAFSIFTTAPNELVGRFHHRMPVILGHNAVSQWLSPDSDPKELTDFFHPYPANLMHEHKVSKAVNNPRNKDASCIAPV